MYWLEILEHKKKSKRGNGQVPPAIGKLIFKIARYERKKVTEITSDALLDKSIEKEKEKMVSKKEFLDSLKKPEESTNETSKTKGINDAIKSVNSISNFDDMTKTYTKASLKDDILKQNSNFESNLSVIIV